MVGDTGMVGLDDDDDFVEAIVGDDEEDDIMGESKDEYGLNEQKEDSKK